MPAILVLKLEGVQDEDGLPMPAAAVQESEAATLLARATLIFGPEP